MTRKLNGSHIERRVRGEPESEVTSRHEVVSHQAFSGRGQLGSCETFR